MIIEHRMFRLRADVDEATFLRADAAVQQQVAPFVPGFVRRTTARGDDGRWLVETLWSTLDGDPPELDPDHPAVASFAACTIDDSVECWDTLD